MPEDHRKRATKREGREGSRTPYYLLQKTQGGMCGVDGLAEWDGADRSNLILNSRAAPSSDRYRTWVSVDGVNIHSELHGEKLQEVRLASGQEQVSSKI